jgi:hypothetical protein
MTRTRRLQRLELAHHRVHARITDAYWTFTRTARGKPPVLAVPGAYAERRRIEALMSELRRAGR